LIGKKGVMLRRKEIKGKRRKEKQRRKKLWRSKKD